MFIFKEGGFFFKIRRKNRVLRRLILRDGCVCPILTLTPYICSILLLLFENVQNEIEQLHFVCFLRTFPELDMFDILASDVTLGKQTI